MPFIILSLLIAALVFAILAALNKPSKFNMIGSALACYFLSIILPLLRTLFLITMCVALLSGCDTLSATYKAATTGYNLSASGQTGIVNDDAIIVNTEKALVIATDTFDLFLKLEYDNRQGLEKVSPKIHDFAENLRRNGKNWIKSAQKAKNVYSQNRTAENHANLLTAYKTLKAAIEESQSYITKHSGV